MSDWYLVQCIVNSEFKAQEHLNRQGYKVFLPLLADQPLFPGYLFIEVQAEQSVSPVSSTRGVQKLVGFGNGPTKVHQTIIDSLRELSGLGIEALDKIPEGTLVEVTEGPFKYLKGIVTAKKAERIFVVLQLMNRDLELEFNVKQLEVA